MPPPAQVAKQQQTHHQLGALLAAQAEAAAAALRDYEAVTAKAEKRFNEQVATAPEEAWDLPTGGEGPGVGLGPAHRQPHSRGAQVAEAARLDAKGGMEAVEHNLKARQELLANERVTAGRTMEAALRPLREILDKYRDAAGGSAG